MKIVAASCSNIREVHPQPAWSKIRAERPDVLLLLGDNVCLERGDRTEPAALARELRSLYGRQFAVPGSREPLIDSGITRKPNETARQKIAR